MGYDHPHLYPASVFIFWYKVIRMEFVINNIRLCFSMVLMLLGTFLITCNKPAVVKKAIPTYRKVDARQSNSLKDTLIQDDSNRVALYLSFDDGPTRGSSAGLTNSAGVRTGCGSSARRPPDELRLRPYTLMTTPMR